MITNTQTSMLPGLPEAQYAFKDLMTHGILQFALRIAFRCVLHRCKSQDIHCWKLFSDFVSWDIIKYHHFSLDFILFDWFIIWFSLSYLHSCKHKFQHFQLKTLINNSQKYRSWIACGNDPSAGSPTETLLRLHLPLDGKVWITSRIYIPNKSDVVTIRNSHRTIQSVGATGGVYKGQGRNQCKLMTCVY